MKLREIMTEDVEVVSPDTTLQEAARIMKERDIGSLPICDNDRLVGMVTDRDIVIRAIAENRDISSTQIRDVMTSPIVFSYDDEDVGEVARIMEARKVRRVVVLNRDKRLVGIATLDNLAENQALSGEVLANLTHTIHSQAAA